MSKIREALKESHAMLERIHNAYSDSNEDVTIYQLRKTIAAVELALTEPLKNCEVGTAKEQYRRFCYCCTKHKMPCRRSYTFGCAECYSKWSQMPYESEVKNG